MRIALVVPVFYPYIAGMSRTAAQEAEILARAGHNVTMITPRFKRAHSAVEQKEGYTIRRLRPILSYSNAAILPSLVFALSGYDAVHLHYPFIGGVIWTLLGVKIARMRGRSIKLIVTYHMDLVGRGLTRYIFALATNMVLPFVVRMADAVRVSSMDYARNSRYARKLFQYPVKLKEIPFGVDTAVFRPRERSAELIKKYNLSADDKFVLFVGVLDRAHYFKGLSVLFRALAEHFVNPHIKLVIVGDGDTRSAYEHLANILKIENRVRFAGTVSGAVLPEFYSIAHVVVLPSVDSSEAFGMALVESQACGTPVVASDLPGVRSVVEAGKTGLLAKAGDAADLAEAIKNVINAPDYGEWRARSRTRAEQLYNAENELQELEKLYVF